MKSFVGNILKFVVIMISLVFLFALPQIESRILMSNTNDLVSQTCQKTPSPSLCQSTLRADPKSSGADLKTLGLIMVNAVKSKIEETLKHVTEQLGHQKQETMRQGLKTCGTNYNAVIVADVPEAIEALTKGAYKFAEQGMRDAALEAESCEREFEAGKSPLTDFNNASRDVANIAVSIVRMIMTT